MKKRHVAIITAAAALACMNIVTAFAGEPETEPVNETELQSEASSVGIWPEVAGSGITYANLFDVILSDGCQDIWYQNCAELVGEENAEVTVTALQSSISGDLYGEDAIAAYADSEEISFDCWYINDAKTFTFEYNDDTMSATIRKTDDTEESHTYEYLGVYQVGADETMSWGGQEISPAFDCDVYQSTDDAGEFTYLLLRDDTMEKTYHIEFRYGSDLDELQKYMKGSYAYWLAAGIDQDADQETIENVITLFCEENAG